MHDRITQDSLEQVSSLAAQGLWTMEIAREMETSHSSVLRMAKMLGIQISRHADRNESTADIIRREIQDMSQLEAVDFLIWVIDELTSFPEEIDIPLNVDLTPTPTRLLAYMLRHQGRVLSKRQIHEALYASDSNAPEIKIIDVYVCGIRKVLPPHVKIETEWGKGYRLTVGQEQEDES